MKEYPILSMPSPNKLTDREITEPKALWSYLPSLRKYGGEFDTYEDVENTIKGSPLQSVMVAMELYTQDIRKIWPSNVVEYVKNAIKTCAKVMDSPCDLLQWWQEINTKEPGYNLYHRIIEKYHWDE